MYFSATGTSGTIKWDDKYYNRDEVLKLVAQGKTDPPEIFLIPTDLRPPKTYQFSLGIRQMITSDMFISLSYTGVRGYNEITTYDANYRDAKFGKRVLTTSYGRINVWTDAGNTWYDGIYLTLDKNYKPGSWGLQLAYTLSWAKDEFDNNIYYGYLYYSRPDQLKKANSTLDERHKISINFIVDLPLKFQLSAWGTFSTGRPYLIFTGSDDNYDSLIGNDYPAGEGRNAGRVPNQKFIFNNMFASRVVNIRLAKIFSFQRYRIMLMVDAFNVFNQVNYAGYIGNMKSAKFGQPTSAGASRQVTVRYYGLYGNAHRGKVHKAQPDQHPFIIVEEESPRVSRRGWAEMIRKVFEVDPLTCPSCGSRMRIIAFITDQAVVDRIIHHLKLTFVAERPPPPHVASQQLLMAT